MASGLPLWINTRRISKIEISVDIYSTMAVSLLLIKTDKKKVKYVAYKTTIGLTMPKLEMRIDDGINKIFLHLLGDCNVQYREA